MASVKALFIPLCLQPTKRRSLIYIFKKEKGKKRKHLNLLGARPPLYLPSTFQQRSRGSEAAQTHEQAGGRAGETAAKGGGHKICMLEETRWT